MTINISPETKVGKVKGYMVEDHMKSAIDEYTIVDDNGKEYPPMDKPKFDDFVKKMDLSVASNGVLYKQDKVGVIPEILNVWFDTRVEYKDQMKKYGKAGNDELYKFYHQRQLVQKIMLNSLYGVLGLPAFRFYDVDNAEAVTLTGQTVIKTTEMIANQYYSKHIGKTDDYNIYVDTDSVFYQAAPLVKARNPEIDENDEEDSSMLAARLTTGKNDYVVSVEKTYSNYYNNDKVTMPYMTKFEKAKLLGVRAEMIASGDKPLVEIKGKVNNAYEIAIMELKQKKIPLIIRRTLPNGKIEDWRVEELIIKST
jgi:DNA-directed RNA polymerase I, II, and III subunit RPABC2